MHRPKESRIVLRSTSVMGVCGLAWAAGKLSNDLDERIDSVDIWLHSGDETRFVELGVCTSEPPMLELQSPVGRSSQPLPQEPQTAISCPQSQGRRSQLAPLTSSLVSMMLNTRSIAGLSSRPHAESVGSSITKPFL